MRNRSAEEGGLAPSDELTEWAAWALVQADRIDPVRSGRFVESMKDEEPNAMADDNCILVIAHDMRRRVQAEKRVRKLQTCIMCRG